MIREVHTAVRGRARYRIKGLYRCERLQVALEAGLIQNRGVTAVSANVLTGTVLVLFDPQLNLKAIRNILEEVALGYFRSGAVKQQHAVDAQNVTKMTPGRDFSAICLADANSPTDGPDWHCMAADSVVEKFGGSRGRGLDEETAERNRVLYGPNSFADDEPRSGVTIFLEQFNSLPVILLGVAACLSVATGGVADAMAIAAVVGINAVIGYVTERQAEEAINSLRNMVKPISAILREGELREISAEEVVTGDLLALRPGTYVSADARVIEAHHLTVDESILTGESMPATKTGRFLDKPDLPLGDRANMVYAGTLVTGGHGFAVVVATGSRTEAGRIRSLVMESRPPETPIERQLDQVGNQLVLLSGAVCAMVFIVGVLRGNGLLPMLKTAVSLAVAAVPEGLPAVATTTLALGAKDMQRHGVLVRDLDAICTLGSVQTLCFDKTGTVTVNKMSVLRIFAGTERIEPLVGPPENCTTGGDFSDDNEVLKLVKVCALCNESCITDCDGTYSVAGTATENALVHLALAWGVDVDSLRSQYPRIGTGHRSEDRRFMTTIHTDRDGSRLVAIKGSPPEVLAGCTHFIKRGELHPITEEDRDLIETENDFMAGEALRVLGVGFAVENGHCSETGEDGFVWLGLVGMADPLRSGVRESVRRFHGAGLETLMITGDQSPTAYAVGKELGLNNGKPLEILDSNHLHGTHPDVLKALCNKAQVFSRVSPSDKLRIVQALQAAGKVVAMTGDGINDGPALRAADIGVAMGRGGTDVAREVADVVLEEDDLETLTIAIRDGRTIYLNIRKALHYLLATNLSEIEVMFVGGALGIGYPLNAMQLLWINLISDIFPGLALALDPPEPDVMERPPRDPAEPIVQKDDFKRIFFEAGTIAVSSLAAYGYGIMRYGIGARAGTIAFHSIAASQILHALTCRSAKGLSDNGHGMPNKYLTGAVLGSLALQVIVQIVPGLRGLLGLTGLGALDCLAVASTGLLPLLVSEATKRGNSVRTP